MQRILDTISNLIGEDRKFKAISLFLEKRSELEDVLSDELFNRLEDSMRKTANNCPRIKSLIGFLVGNHQHIDLDTFPEHEVEMGKEVEKEHLHESLKGTEIGKMIALNIAKDHLAESAKYYTYLHEMEEKFESEDKI